MPTEDMHDALAIEQVKTKPFGFAPLVVPACPSRPVPRLPRAASPSTLRPRGHKGPINAQHQDRTAKTASRDLGHASLNLLARRRHFHHTEACGYLVRDRVHALTTDRNPTESAKQRRGCLIRDLCCEIHCGLLHVTLEPTRAHVQRLVEWIGPRTADRTIEVGPLQFDSPHQGLDAAMHRAAGGQQACTGGTGPRRSMLFLWMRVVHDRLGHATAQLLPYGPDGLAHLA